MIQLGSYTFQSDTEYFRTVMQKYLRKIPPIPTNIYLNSSRALEVENRIKVASLCQFPPIINILAHDEDYHVSEAARKNDFWLLVGQLQDVLGFGKKERKEFARQEVIRIIVVILMFEDDIDVIREALRNASLSTKMLSIFIQLLEERGRGKKDSQILEDANGVILEKRTRIIKASEINKARKNLNTTDNIKIILSRLSDHDKVIRKAIGNILSDMDPVILHRFVTTAIEDPPDQEILNQFVSLTELLTLTMRREDIKRAPTSYLERPDWSANAWRKMSIAEYFYQNINTRRRELIARCEQNLTEFQNILLLAYCHCDTDSEIRNLAKSIITIDDLFALVNDYSTPQHHFRKILSVLSEHPDEQIQKRVVACFQTESKRLWSRMRELEQSIHAYFDLIFQSLGFRKINEFLQIIKSLKHVEKSLHRYTERFDNDTKDKLKNAEPAFDQVNSILIQQIQTINSDVSKDVLKELREIHPMIKKIIDLKNFGLEGLRPGIEEDVDRDILLKARTIWHSALGQFLGRVKNLNEMIKAKFIATASLEIPQTQVFQETDDALAILEINHKKKIQCTLTIACAQCNRRGCSSERFLTEAEFFMNELLDNFVEE